MYQKKTNRLKRKFFKKANNNFYPEAPNYAKAEDTFEEPVLMKGGKAFQKALQSRDKYLDLARDAQMSGDRVGAENYFQHADHFNRLILTASSPYNERPTEARPRHHRSSYSRSNSTYHQEREGENHETKDALPDANPASMLADMPAVEPREVREREPREQSRPRYHRSSYNRRSNSSYQQAREGDSPKNNDAEAASKAPSVVAERSEASENNLKNNE